MSSLVGTWWCSPAETRFHVKHPPEAPAEPPPAPTAARGVFGSRLPSATRYVEWLATEGIVRGLLGPREVPRLWERHVLNCAAVAEAIPRGATVADLGSGAGLPGVVLALTRPDLSVTLIEPLLRRSDFLGEVVADLGLENCEVVRARGEELAGSRTFEVVTSRAVAALPRLAQWSLPLVAPGGVMLAMKGSRVAEELTAAEPVVTRWGGGPPEVIRVGTGVVDPPPVLVRVVRSGTGAVG